MQDKDKSLRQRTRGPRTAGERATDAARSTATRFERLPASHFADEYLKPIAVLLRFLVGTAYADSEPRLRDLRGWDEIEGQLYEIVGRFERDAEYMPLRDALEFEKMIDSARSKLRKAKGVMAAALEGGDDA